MNQIPKKLAFAVVLVIAALLAAWRFLWQTPAEEVQTPEPKTPPTTQPASTDSVPSAMEGESTQKRASVKTSYSNPGGSDEVGFAVTVDESGVITSAAVDVLAKNPISKMRQEAFAEGFPAAIKGKKLEELTAIDKVGGSSLTTASFNKSLEDLKEQI